MNELTHENFASTEFILKHNVLLNRTAIPQHTLTRLKTFNRAKYRTPARNCNEEMKVLHPYHQWLKANTMHETRTFDCLHSTEFVDPDPIPELFPNETMSYLATVFDPDAVPACPGITDMLDVLYRSKFGPGTPQAFLYETPIIGWVMYYELNNVTWIAEIQGNNTLRGGVLGRATGRRHFYRRILKDFLLATPQADTYVLLPYEHQEKIHAIVRPSKPLPPAAPYRSDIMEWCGFARKPLGETDVSYKTHAPIDLLTDKTEVWHFAPGQWRAI
jgi:hypothetical protein